MSKIKIGEVIKKSSPKTISVRVRRLKKHPRYHKKYWVEKKYLCHYEKGIFEVGEMVKIKQSRPISKRKKWVVVGKEEKTKENKG